MKFAAFVNQWAKEAHQMSTAKEFIQSESLSKVVRRHQATKIDAFLYEN
jgi:hypothetical protein